MSWQTHISFICQGMTKNGTVLNLDAILDNVDEME